MVRSDHGRMWHTSSENQQLRVKIAKDALEMGGKNRRYDIS